LRTISTARSRNGEQRIWWAICRLEIWRERLFGIDVTAGLGRGEDHRGALVEMARTYRNELGFFAREHLPIVGVAFGDTEPRLGFLASGAVGVGDGDQLHRVEYFPDRIQPMAVIAPAGVG
jgi:hypothetical protein